MHSVIKRRIRSLRAFSFFTFSTSLQRIYIYIYTEYPKIPPYYISLAYKFLNLSIYQFEVNISKNNKITF